MNRSLRRPLVRLNNRIGKLLGFKLRKVPYSRPATLRAKAMFGDRPIRVIEIGCAAGTNALDILEQLNVAEYVVVDPYEHASSSYDDYNRARLATMREQARKRLQKYEDKLVWIYAMSSDAVTQITGLADYIYVDGDHSYGAALADMKAYFPLLADRYVFGGHDIDRPGVARAFVEFVSGNAVPNYEIQDPDWVIYTS